MSFFPQCRSATVSMFSSRVTPQKQTPCSWWGHSCSGSGNRRTHSTDNSARVCWPLGVHYCSQAQYYHGLWQVNGGGVRESFMWGNQKRACASQKMRPKYKAQHALSLQFHTFTLSYPLPVFFFLFFGSRPLVLNWHLQAKTRCQSLQSRQNTRYAEQTRY